MKKRRSGVYNNYVKLLDMYLYVGFYELIYLNYIVIKLYTCIINSCPRERPNY